MLNKTQQQIMESWESDKPCLVSVICITYNHKLYIRKAIESFLIQKTNFPFEVIIHDDASTDNTQEIISEYVSRYPDIIKPVFQKENQFLKDGFEPTVYATTFATGEFFAICEGDDYWIDDQKLQIQVDAMLKHPSVDFSFHSAMCLRNGIMDKKPSWNYGEERIFFPDKILSTVGQFAPTASYMLRREVIEKLPDWYFKTAPIGDFFFEMYGAQRGGALYLHRTMSIYRFQLYDSCSFSSRMRSSAEASKSRGEKMVESLQLLEKDFQSFSYDIQKIRAITLFSIAYSYLKLKDDKNFKEYMEKSFDQYRYSKRQWSYYALRHLPWLLRFFIKVKSLIGIQTKKHWGTH